MDNCARYFTNYEAFKTHFKPLVIEKIGKDEYIASYDDELKTNSQGCYWIQRGTKEYINGWLYGAVQVACGQLRRKTQ